LVPHLPSRSLTLSRNGHRYYAPLRLPNVHLGFVRYSLSLPDTLTAPLDSCPFFRLAGSRDAACRRQGSCIPDSPSPGASSRKHSDLPSSRVTPVSTCPALRPRWCPPCSPSRGPGLLPSVRIKAVGFPSGTAPEGYPSGPRLYIFRGSTTRPAPSLHPASDARYRVCPRISLLPCWLGFRQVGLSPTG